MDDIPPFPNLRSVINFYLLKNPARQKFVNVLEPERYPVPHSEDFTGDSPRDQWSSIANAIHNIIDAVDSEKRTCFTVRYLFPSDFDSSIETIAKGLKISTYKVRKNISYVENKLSDELVRRELISPEIE